RFGSSLGPIYTPATPMVVEGFSLNVAADGSWHRHYDFVLTPPATDGIYLLALSLSSSDPTIEPSKPFYVVFNQNEAESTHDASIAYVESSLVPEPHTCLLALGGLASCLAWVRRDRR
ncbi:MAG: hypothetical protein KDA60_19110, partial [Planctomycetales bacterium]|nr:hypothetical protein [Planctomycetales bacterium]